MKLIVGLLVASMATAFENMMPESTAHCHVFCADKFFDICKPTNTCRILPLHSDHRRNLVMTHNDYRKTVALGKAGLPRAADMMYVTHDWNTELAARILVANCNRTFYQTCRKTSLMRRFAMNTYVAHKPPGFTFTNQELNLAMHAWYAEVRQVPASVITTFFKANATNATTLMSSEVLKLGCAASLDEDDVMYVVCTYFPAPLSGRALYAVGGPCSAPSCDRCTSYAFGLCNGPAPYAGEETIDTSSASVPVLLSVVKIFGILGSAVNV